ncbi:DedA family protein [Dietzia timorensis]|uniref:Putative membrane protein n=1 Tax=Dietzia timorensis TaxID=499555 RepID=A0A173LQ39_9ACTN|nr:DedA family protein [Dietzia timorensis]ANI93651.1 putative membrane protein [Dietzia timorensis]
MQDSVLALGGSDVRNLAVPGGQILDPDFWLSGDGPFGNFILPVLLAVVFIESGLLFPFLPGDSLLFTAGLLTRLDDPFAPLWVILVTAPIAAFLGDQVGYWIGHKFEKPLLARPDGRIFKQAYIRESHEFFEKHGPITIVICRFVPIVRTYAPLVAGMSGMRYKVFITYNVIGAVAWAAGVTFLGWLLGEIQFIRDHIDLILILIVLVSVLPMIIAGARKIYARRKLANSESVPERAVDSPAAES